jgi:hypothetical protein
LQTLVFSVKLGDFSNTLQAGLFRRLFGDTESNYDD